VTEEKITDDELEAQRPDLLRSREPMSLVSTDPGAYTPGVEGFATSSPEAGAAGGAVDSASGLASGASDLASTDTAASGSGDESVTSEDRSEQISSSDSAYSET
jgi:hypothetical protein